MVVEGDCAIVFCTIHGKINWYKLSRNNIFLWFYSFTSKTIFICTRMFITALCITLIRVKYWKRCKSPKIWGGLKKL